MTTTYAEFLARRAQLEPGCGFEPTYLPGCLFDFQQTLADWAVRQGRGSLLADTGMGKAVDLTTKVLTPNGWVTAAEVRPGDLIIGSDGAPTKVVGVYPQPSGPMYRVAFGDGVSCVVNGDHLWTVQEHNDSARRPDRWRVMSTLDLLAAGLTYGRAGKQRKWRIPLISAPVLYDPQTTLPIDPYLLGVFLGDGHSTPPNTAELSTDLEILEAIGARSIAPAPGCWTGRVSIPASIGLAGLRAWEKFVPEQFLRSAPADRLALLQGLMDTDGSPMADGGAEFSSTSEALVDAVIDLTQGFGGLARNKTSRITRFTHKGEVREGRRSWRVNLKLPVDILPFRLSRKLDRWVPPTKYQAMRPIASIEYDRDAVSVCFKVDAPDSLFVIENHIVTHNTIMELVWAQNVHLHTGKPVLLFTPLAVGFQIAAEAARFGIDASVSRDGSIPSPITITNYERLDKFDPSKFAGGVCDEASVIKSFEGSTRAQVTEFLRLMPYRLLATATAAPNDYIELGTLSEALGQLGYVDMLNRFFTNKQKTSGLNRHMGQAAEWRFKGHAEHEFWRWVSSWARAIRKPSDYGFPDGDFILPDLEYRTHIVEACAHAEGTLFDVPAKGLREEREETRRTLHERCEAAAALVADADSAVSWCQLNDESALLAKLIDGAVEVTGSDSIDEKEEKLSGFSKGEIRVLVIKPKIGALGLNWQHCNRMTYFPNHSYQEFYQAVRRSWRFGQKRPVTVDIVATEGGKNALASLHRKAAQADAMFTSLVKFMNDAVTIDRSTTYDQEVQIPTWV